MNQLTGDYKNHSFSWLLNKHIAILFISMCLVIAIVAQLSININDDVGSHIILSQRLMNNLQVDDPNPPLIFYLLMLPNIISNATKISVLIVFKIGMFLLIVMSLLFCNKILNNVVNIHVKHVLMITLCFVITLLPEYDFGQREHIYLILVMPYFFLVGRRLSGNKVNHFQATFIGILAGIGFCLKPHYLLLPLVIQIYSYFKHNKIYSWKNMENIAIISLAVFYILFIFAFHHEYITKTIPEIIYLYNAKNAYNADTIQLLYKLSSLIFVMLVYWIARNQKDFSPLGNILLLITIGSAITFFIQGKGWRYHLHPFVATSYIFILYCIYIINIRRDATSLFKIISNSLTIIIIFAVLFPVIIRHLGEYRNSKIATETVENKLVNIIKLYGNGSNIYFFSTSVKPVFPVVNYSGSGWSSRYNCLWTLPGILKNKEVQISMLNGPKQKAIIEMENNLMESVLTDLQTQPPSLIIVDNHRYKLGLGKQKFDFMKYFLKNPFFKKFMSQYQELTWLDEFQVFKRISKNN